MKKTIEMQYNSPELKKRLGAFFTPDYAVEKSTKYLRDIISSLPDDNYVIVDRCCGTGNLEKFLTDEELSHCILNTINYAEWLTMKGLYEGRAKAILPIDESSLEVNDGLLKAGDALEESFYNTLLPMIKGKTVILLENPPYSDTGSVSGQKKEKGTVKQNSYIANLMTTVKGVAKNDLANKFIWSAFNVIKADYYVVYSPVKYFKSQNLVNKKFIEGCLVNRKDFHATEAGISIMSWKNEDEVVDSWQLENSLIKRISKKGTENMPSNDTDKIIVVNNHGGTTNFMSIRVANFDGGSNCTGTKRWLGINNIKQGAPLIAAAFYVCKDFTEKEVIMKSGDGGTAYLQDNDFVNDCLIFCGLTNKNKCISNKTIKNECCIGQATKLDSLIDASAYQGKAKALKLAWDMVLTAARACSEFNPAYNYGLYQIEEELNVKQNVVKVDGTYATNKKGELVKEHKYPALNAAIGALKKELTKYYTTYIVPKLFSYELLK